jgi:ABC-type nickel/cobalt efflux system permease component RcnA
LLLCIQVKEFTLGAALVLCFSIGLAITLVSVGAAAAFSVRQATKRWSGLDSAGAAGSILLKRTDCTCRHLHGLSRLDRRNELIFSCMNLTPEPTNRWVLYF